MKIRFFHHKLFKKEPQVPNYGMCACVCVCVYVSACQCLNVTSTIYIFMHDIVYLLHFAIYVQQFPYGTISSSIVKRFELFISVYIHVLACVCVYISTDCAYIYLGVHKQHAVSDCRFLSRLVCDLEAHMVCQDRSCL